MTWSATQYSKFENERNRPALDLLGRVPGVAVATAVDLGCGPGNSTQLLRNRFPDAAIVGIDSSTDMIAAARARLPQLRFDVMDIADWNDKGPFDLIFANAVLHWLPNHERLFPKLCKRLAPGGTLAVQMPDNLDEPAHHLMREIAADGPWRDKLRAACDARAAPRGANWYYELLQANAREVDVWRTTYNHRLAGGAADVVEWFRGTGLRPFIEPLDEDERKVYLARYQRGIAHVYPALPDGSILLPFPRLFIVATR